MLGCVAGCPTDRHGPPAVNGAAGGGADGHLSLVGAGPLTAGGGARHHQGKEEQESCFGCCSALQ